MRVIAVLSVRNEEWFLERTLRTLSSICDDILVIDQCSTDRTPEICRRFEKVRYTRSNVPDIPERGRATLLAAAREIEDRSVIIALDADEILTADALGPEFGETLRSLRPGDALVLPWITLWKHPRWYRDDRSVWANYWLACIFRDDGTAAYGGHMHEGRLPAGLVGEVRRYAGVKVLHYQFAVWDRTRSKQAHYRIRELKELLGRSSTWINEMHAKTKDERGIRLARVPDDWIQGWRAAGVDLGSVEDEDFSWFDVEVLRTFAERGPRAFADLDIWDIDWEAKRQIALARGTAGIPLEPIEDPRTIEQRMHHWYLERFMTAPFWRDPTVPLRPARRLLKRLGITRSSLRRLASAVLDRSAPGTP